MLTTDNKTMGPSLHLQFDHQGVDSTSKCNRGNRQGVIASVDTEVSAEPRPRRRCWLVSDVSRRDVTGRDKVLERVERRQECQAAKIEHFNAMAALSVAQSHCAPRVGRPRKRMGATMAYNTLACLHARAQSPPLFRFGLPPSLPH